MAGAAPQENIPLSLDEINTSLKVKVPPEKMRTLRGDPTTRSALQKLSTEYKEQGENIRLQQALAFIDANQVTPADHATAMMAGAAVESGTVDPSRRRELEGQIRANAAAGATVVGATSVGGMVADTLRDATKDAMGEVTKPGFWKGHMGGFMKEMVESMLEAKKEGGVAGFFAGLGLIFFKPFIKKLGLSAEQLKELGIDVAAQLPQASATGSPDAPGKDAEKQKEAVEVRKRRMYTLSTVVLGEVVGNNYKDVTKIYQLPELEKLSIGDIRNFATKNDIVGLRTRIGIQTDVPDDTVREFLRAFSDKTHPFYPLVIGTYEKSKTEPKIPDAKIYDVLGSIDLSILRNLHSIDITNLEESLKSNTTKMITLGEDGSISGELVDKGKEMGLSTNLMKALLRSRNAGFYDTRSFATLKESLPDKKDKEMLDALGKYGEGFLSNLKTDERWSFGLGGFISSDIHTSSNSKVFFDDILKSYILTGGKQKLDDMNTTEKLGAYSAFSLIMTSTSEGAAKLTGSIFNFGNVSDLITGNSIFEKIPEDVKNLMGQVFSAEAIWKVFKGMAGGFADSVKGFATESPGFVGILAIIMIFFPWVANRRSPADILKRR